MAWVEIRPDQIVTVLQYYFEVRRPSYTSSETVVYGVYIYCTGWLVVVGWYHCHCQVQIEISDSDLPKC
jgi:proteasome lid subunit RPN8/RPN11